MLHDLRLSFLPYKRGMKTGRLQKLGELDETMLLRCLEQSSEHSATRIFVVICIK